MYKIWKNIKVVIDEYNLIPLFILIGSVASINFASYINHFDRKVFLLLDLGAVSKHILHFILIYSIVIAMTNLIALILVNPIIAVLEELKWSIPEKKYRLFLKYTFSIIVFLLYYVGLDNTIDMIFHIIYIIFIAVFVDIFIKAKNKITNQDTKKSRFMKLYTTIVKHKFNVATLFLLLLVVSYLLGKNRAKYIKKTSLVFVNNTEIKESLFVTTASAVGLYNIKDKTISFISWDNIKKLEFIKD